MALEHIVKFEPSWHFTNPINLHAMEITFIIKGDMGAVLFRVNSHWYAQQSLAHLAKFSPVLHSHAICFEYHGKEPSYEGQALAIEHCEKTGGKCFFDCSYTKASDWWEPFVLNGSDWLWSKLDEEYYHYFHKQPAPDLTSTPRKRTK